MAGRIDLNGIVDDPSIALHLLANDKSTKALDTVKCLLDSGQFKVNQRESQDNLTPLHIAAHWDNLHMVQLLIHYGADPLAFSGDEECPMDLATGQSKKFLESFCNKRGEKKKQRKIFKFLRHLFQPRKLKSGKNDRPRCPSAPPAILSLTDNKTDQIFEYLMIEKRFEKERPSGASDLTFFTATEGNRSLSLKSVEDLERTPRADEINKTVRNGLKKDDDQVLLTPTAPFLSPQSTPQVTLRRKLHTPPTPKPRTTSLKPPITPRKSLDIGQPQPLTQQNISNHDEYAQILSKTKPRKESFITNDSSFSDQEEETENIPEEVLTEVKGLKINELKDRLKSLNAQIGPIDSANRSLYEKKLAKLMVKDNSMDELSKTLGSLQISGKYSQLLLRFISTNEEVGHEQETLLCQMHEKLNDSPKPSIYYCYALLDPRKLFSGKQSTFEEFVASIFYIGKGVSQRAHCHLSEALDHEKNLGSPNAKKYNIQKVERILDIWKMGNGVIVLQVFHNIQNDEALTREAGLIAAIGLTNLTNLKSGEPKLAARSWTPRELQCHGVHQLHRMFGTYKHERCKPLKREDVIKDFKPAQRFNKN